MWHVQFTVLVLNVILVSMRVTLDCRLPAVEETILKRKKRIDIAQARQARAHLRAKKVPIFRVELH